MRMPSCLYKGSSSKLQEKIIRINERSGTGQKPGRGRGVGQEAPAGSSGGQKRFAVRQDERARGQAEKRGSYARRISVARSADVDRVSGGQAGGPRRRLIRRRRGSDYSLREGGEVGGRPGRVFVWGQFLTRAAAEREHWRLL